MRAIWKGAISFGLVTIPVRLFTAIDEHNVTFHQVRRSDGSRIRYKRIAEADGTEVPYADIAKGYELPGGEMVVLTDEDLADLPLPTSRVVDVLTFVPLEQIDPIYFAKSYYLEPDKPAVKPYVLLRDALEQSGMAGLVKVAIRTRETLGTLRVRDGVLVLETMTWPDEVRSADFPFLDEDVTIRPQELSMAGSLIESMAGDFDPTQYRDDYREALQQVIEAKIAGHAVVEAPTEVAAAGGGVADLMATLRASVAAAKRSRGEVESPDTTEAVQPEADAAEAPPGEDHPTGTTARTPARTGGSRSGRAKAPARTGTRAAAKATTDGKPAKATKTAATKTTATKTAATKTTATAGSARRSTPARATAHQGATAPAENAVAKQSADAEPALDGVASAPKPAKKTAKKTASRRSA